RAARWQAAIPGPRPAVLAAAGPGAYSPRHAPAARLPRRACAAGLALQPDRRHGTRMIALTHAMVLAAGLGTRMRPLTDDRPKPLLELDGRSLLDHALDRLAAAGVTQAVVNAHWRGEQIAD